MSEDASDLMWLGLTGVLLHPKPCWSIELSIDQGAGAHYLLFISVELDLFLRRGCKNSNSHPNLTTIKMQVVVGKRPGKESGVSSVLLTQKKIRVTSPEQVWNLNHLRTGTPTFIIEDTSEFRSLTWRMDHGSALPRGHEMELATRDSQGGHGIRRTSPGTSNSATAALAAAFPVIGHVRGVLVLRWQAARWTDFARERRRAMFAEGSYPSYGTSRKIGGMVITIHMRRHGKDVKASFRLFPSEVRGTALVLVASIRRVILWSEDTRQQRTHELRDVDALRRSRSRYVDALSSCFLHAFLAAKDVVYESTLVGIRVFIRGPLKSKKGTTRFAMDETFKLSPAQSLEPDRSGSRQRSKLDVKWTWSFQSDALDLDFSPTLTGPHPSLPCPSKYRKAICNAAVAEESFGPLTSEQGPLSVAGTCLRTATKIHRGNMANLVAILLFLAHMRPKYTAFASMDARHFYFENEMLLRSVTIPRQSSLASNSTFTCESNFRPREQALIKAAKDTSMHIESFRSSFFSPFTISEMDLRLPRSPLYSECCNRTLGCFLLKFVWARLACTSTFVEAAVTKGFTRPDSGLRGKRRLATSQYSDTLPHGLQDDEQARINHEV
ncbi:hypothetical protein SISNIDRAFT_471625 [Sistotremastrum niveocremeum HHB9708]|uniref:Uncharacterized protein n=1 Tax=Sistotremastrum niveocremeum HHB9708 TaxID=1314777 RepID=A0A164MF28_9AGAM|nr:hypothetical protein SISNIDRAFT_471625 [Sistotremastrum niveocremeum HHB9708]